MKKIISFPIYFIIFSTCQLTAQNVGIGTQTPLYKLDIAGNINITKDSAYQIAGWKILRVKDSTSLFIGKDAGDSVTVSGVSNTFTGMQSGQKNTSGNSNSFYGYQSGNSNTTGIGNSAFGVQSGFYNIGGGANSFFGDGSGYYNSTGASNSFFGYGSGSGNTTGSNNSFFGERSGRTNAASNNSFFGYETGYNNADGDLNCFFGEQSGYNNLDGSVNCFFGESSGYNNTSGFGNSFFGRQSGNTNKTGNSNCFFGLYSGLNNGSGSNNVAVGMDAGSNLTTGSNNTFIGNAANSGPGGTLTNSTAIGNGAAVTVPNNFVFGNADIVGWGFGVGAGNRAIKVGTDATNGNGAYLTVGGAWTDVSARNKKEDFTKMDSDDILKKISQLEITRWKYINTGNEYHIGPMADQFHQLFKIGDDNSLSAMDKSGIALLGIQELSRQNENMKILIAALQANINNGENNEVLLEKKMDMQQKEIYEQHQQLVLQQQHIEQLESYIGKLKNLTMQ